MTHRSPTTPLLDPQLPLTPTILGSLTTSRPSTPNPMTSIQNEGATDCHHFTTFWSKSNVIISQHSKVQHSEVRLTCIFIIKTKTHVPLPTIDLRPSPPLDLHQPTPCTSIPNPFTPPPLPPPGQSFVQFCLYSMWRGT